ncbi:DUF489 family protein [Clostridiales bacterium COT073_COT-073]|nr:DUF489 family protein [Clostridiales bacterium COT073_COT-073]
MKGTVVRIWINTLNKMYDKEEIAQILKGVHFDTSRAISPLEDISDQMVDHMMTAIAGRYKIGKAELWKMLGRDNISTFYEMYPIFFKKSNMFLFLCSLNNIHQVVRKRIPGSKPAVLNMEITGQREATLTYISKRNMYDYLLGLLEGTQEFFKEKAEVQVLEKTDGKMILKIHFGYTLMEEKAFTFSNILSLGFIRNQTLKVLLFTLALGLPTAFLTDNSWITMGLTALYAGVGNFLLSRPLKTVKTEITKLINKNYVPSLKIKTKDEYEEIFNHLLEYKEAFAEGFIDLSSMTGEMASFSTDLLEIAREMEVTSGDIAGFIENLYLKALEQSESTEENVMLLTENADKIIRLSEKEMQNKIEIEKAIQITTRSFEKLKNTTQSLNIMKDKFEILKDNSDKLKDKGRETEEIASFVSEIAYQTNLLALNASIEAARAGEMGQGFAVVAEEVRKLAQNSEQAATRIKDNINSLLADIENMVADIHEQNEVLETGADTIQEAIENTQGSKTEMDSVAAKMSDSADELEKQAQNLGEIVIHMKALSNTSNENAEISKSASDQVNHYSEQLEKLTTDIQNFEEMTGQFNNMLTAYKM